MQCSIPHVISVMSLSESDSIQTGRYTGGSDWTYSGNIWVLGVWTPLVDLSGHGQEKGEASPGSDPFDFLWKRDLMGSRKGGSILHVHILVDLEHSRNKEFVLITDKEREGLSASDLDDAVVSESLDGHRNELHAISSHGNT